MKKLILTILMLMFSCGAAWAYGNPMMSQSGAIFVQEGPGQYWIDLRDYSDKLEAINLATANNMPLYVVGSHDFGGVTVDVSGVTLSIKGDYGSEISNVCFSLRNYAAIEVDNVDVTSGGTFIFTEGNTSLIKIQNSEIYNHDKWLWSTSDDFDYVVQRLEVDHCHMHDLGNVTGKGTGGRLKCTITYCQFSYNLFERFECGSDGTVFGLQLGVDDVDQYTKDIFCHHNKFVYFTDNNVAENDSAGLRVLGDQVSLEHNNFKEFRSVKGTYGKGKDHSHSNNKGHNIYSEGAFSIKGTNTDPKLRSKNNKMNENEITGTCTGQCLRLYGDGQIKDNIINVTGNTHDIYYVSEQEHKCGYVDICGNKTSSNATVASVELTGFEIANLDNNQMKNTNADAMLIRAVFAGTYIPDSLHVKNNVGTTNGQIMYTTNSATYPIRRIIQKNNTWYFAQYGVKHISDYLEISGDTYFKEGYETNSYACEQIIPIKNPSVNIVLNNNTCYSRGTTLNSMFYFDPGTGGVSANVTAKGNIWKAHGSTILATRMFRFNDGHTWNNVLMRGNTCDGPIAYIADFRTGTHIENLLMAGNDKFGGSGFWTATGLVVQDIVVRNNNAFDLSGSFKGGNAVVSVNSVVQDNVGDDL